MLGLGRRRKEIGGGAGSATTIQADLSGALISGQVAVGEKIVQIHAEHGAIVNYQTARERPVPVARPVPVRRLPRPFDALVGRGQLLADVHGALARGGPAELVGEPGIGKTSLLRNLAHHLAELQPHGVVYTAVRGIPAGDLLQLLFETFYDCGGETVVATDEELARYLGDRQALILLDDAELDREDLQRVMDVAAVSTFVSAAPTRRVWGDGASFAVPGLAEADATALFERELGRSLGAAEQAVVARWCRGMNGSPLGILQLSGLLRDGQLLSAASLDTIDAARLEQLILDQLSEADRRVIAPLLAAGRAPVPSQVIAATTDVAEAAARLARLEDRHVVQAHSPRYTLAGGGVNGQPSSGADGAAIYDEAADASGALAEWFTRGREPAGDDAERLAEGELLLALLRDAERRGSRDDVIALARAGDRWLALGGRWAAWRIALKAALRAAAQGGSTAEEAWALHQLGSRALGLGDHAAAARHLTRALELREALGDHAGAAVTRHNLDLLAGPPPPPDDPPPKPRPKLPLVGVGAVLLAVLAGVGLATGLSNGGGSHAVTTLAPAKATTPPSSHGPSSSRSPAQSPGATQPPTGTPGTGPPKPPIVSLPASVVVPMSPGGNRLVQGSADPPLTNAGSSPATVTGADVPATGYTASLNCPKSLLPGAKCTVHIDVSGPPRSLTPSATLKVSVAGGESATASVTLCAQASSASGATGNSGPGATGNSGPGATGNSGSGATGNSGPGATGNSGPGATGNSGPGATKNKGPIGPASLTHVTPFFPPC